MTTNYQKGANFERTILDNYVTNPYKKYQGTRSAGSHGLVDAVVWSDDGIVFINCKMAGFSLAYQKKVWKELIRPPNSYLKFFSRAGVEDGDQLALKHGWDKDE